MSGFFERLALIQESYDTLLCIGLDPDPQRFPAVIRQAPNPVFEFNRRIIDATADLVCCYKPQAAHYAALGAEAALEQTINYIRDRHLPVVLDGKRGDVGSTAEKYAAEVFDRYGADAATINPYLGLDAMEPFLAREDKGLFVLCRTSNPGGRDLQELQLKDGSLLYEHVAEQAATRWNQHGNVGLVVGATQPAELRRIRAITGKMPFLVPGIGAQGGDLEATLKAGAGGGMLISSSRAILYAADDNTFAEAARAVAIATRDSINHYQSLL
ncbi:MAG: orotidine-5'-phosphate decarboxylase [Pseudomonadota bacterium]